MQPKAFYVTASVLVALLILASISGLYFYSQASSETQAKNQYLSELTTLNGKYDTLAANYDAVLSDFNQTLSLLSSTVAVVNNSLPAYTNASTELPLLWSSYLKLKPASAAVYTADILLDFGNGTSRWYNGTAVQPGWDAYVATVVLTGGRVDAALFQFPGYPPEHQVFGIDGASSASDTSWFVWTYNSTGWSVSQVGADLIPIYNGTVVAWTLCGYNPTTYAPTCSP